jgi:signal transduction histidine kinase
VLASGEPLEVEERISFDDEFRTFLTIKFPLYNKQGIIYAIGGVAADITHRKQQKDFLLQARIELEQQIAERTTSLLQANHALQAQIAERERTETELRDNQYRLQRLSRRLVAVQEEERHYLARELHDEIGQVLTGVKLSLDTVALTPQDQISDRLSESRAAINELLMRVRHLSLDLRPGMLDDMGLLPTLQWYFERYTERSRICVKFRHKGLERRFSPDVEITIYRIVQETLTNAARYAGIEEISVWLLSNTEYISVRIDDEGVGFDLTALPRQRTGGLDGMRERVELLSGDFTIESIPGEGTHIIADLPLTPSSEVYHSY